MTDGTHDFDVLEVGVDPSLYLDDIKRRYFEMAAQQADIVDLGDLAQGTDENQWYGGISIKSRIEAGEVSQAELDEAARIIGNYYVPTMEGAPERCIDPRGTIGYDDNNPDDYGQGLGPQVPGASPVGGLSWRIAQGNDGKVKITEAALEDDVEDFAETSPESGFTVGGHYAENAPEGKTGCAAIDGMEEDLEHFSPESISHIEKLTQLLLSEKFSPSDFDHLIAMTLRLLSEKERYFASKSRIFEKLKEYNPTDAPVLKGIHKEGLVIVNLVPNTTLHTNHWIAENGDNVLAFNYDLWRTFDNAKRLHADPAIRSRYLHARAGLAVSALMRLTDGSQKLLVRVPAPETAAA
jgi:hypothetical protein